MIRFGRRGLTVLAVGLLIVCLGAGSADAGGSTNREQMGLLGPVQTLVEQVAKYSAPSGEWVEGPCITSAAYVFDEQGNCIEENRYKPDGSLDQRRTYRYDDQGNLREETRHYSSLPSSISSSSSFDCKTVYVWDGNGKVIDASLYGSDGSLLRFYVYVYDSRGNRVEQSEYGANGSLSTKEVYVYDDRGNIAERSEYKPDGSLSARQIHKYDNNGNELENTRYKADGSIDYRRVRTYDENARKSEEVTYSRAFSRVSYYRRAYRYDNKGNVVESTVYDEYGCEKYAYEYEFDPYGNCIKKTTSKWVTQEEKSYWKPWEVTYRIITYY